MLFQYKAAVERVQSFDSEAVIRALEGHQYSMLKDPQEWRAFDHQNVQSVQVVRVNNRDVALQDQFNEDFLEILMSIPGARVAKTEQAWRGERLVAGKTRTCNNGLWQPNATAKPDQPGRISQVCTRSNPLRGSARTAGASARVTNIHRSDTNRVPYTSNLPENF